MTVYGYLWNGSQPRNPNHAANAIRAALQEVDGAPGPVILDDGPLAEETYEKRPGARALFDMIRSGDTLVIEDWPDLGRDLPDAAALLDAVTKHRNISLYHAGTKTTYSHDDLRGLMTAAKILDSLVQRDLRYATEGAVGTMMYGNQGMGYMNMKGRNPIKRSGKRAWNQDGIAKIPDETQIAVMRECWARYQQGETHLAIARDLMQRGVKRNTGRPWVFYQKCIRKECKRRTHRIDYRHVITAIREIALKIAAGNPNHPFLAGWDWQSYLPEEDA